MSHNLQWRALTVAGEVRQRFTATPVFRAFLVLRWYTARGSVERGIW
jgi:hypothetical protein